MVKYSSCLKAFVDGVVNGTNNDALRKCLRIAVIGAPNVGKSSFTNQLVKAAVCAVSRKMDTTQENLTAAITEGDTQLIFVDSPGVVGIKHARYTVRSMGNRLLQDPCRAVDTADYLLIVQDPMELGDYIHHRIMHLLHSHSHIPSSLVINKIDLVQRRSDLLELVRILCCGQVGGKPITTTRKQIGRLGSLSPPKETVLMPLSVNNEGNTDEQWQRKYNAIMAKKTYECPWFDTKKVFMNIRGWPNFDSVFFVSSFTGEGIDDVRKHLCSVAQKKNHRFPKGLITTKSPQKLCLNAIRAQLLEHLPSEVAYNLNVLITEWQTEGDVLQIVTEVRCDKERHARLVLGRSGMTIISIGKNVNEIMQNLFKQQLFVRILVKANGKLVDFTNFLNRKTMNSGAIS